MCVILFMTLYPLLFEPNLHPVVWGGEQLCSFKGLDPVSEPIGESWEVSAVPSSISIVSNGTERGRNLVEVINDAPAEMLGMAQRVHGKMGKSEMWYVIKAEEGSYLYAGFKEHITPYEYQRRVEDGSITDVLARHEVKAGDVFYIPAGRVHAICGGIMLAEVQQSSDVTYRIYDYNRPGMDGKPRELHTELAAQAIDYHVEQEYRTVYSDKKDSAIQIIDSPYFDVRVTEMTGLFHRNLLKYDSFIISACIEGDCKIRIRTTGDEILLKKGNSCLIPAAIADYDVIPVEGRTRILDAFIDNMDRSLVGKVNRFLHITTN